MVRVILPRCWLAAGMRRVYHHVSFITLQTTKTIHSNPARATFSSVSQTNIDAQTCMFCRAPVSFVFGSRMVCEACAMSCCRQLVENQQRANAAEFAPKMVSLVAPVLADGIILGAPSPSLRFCALSSG